MNLQNLVKVFNLYLDVKTHPESYTAIEVEDLPNALKKKQANANTNFTKAETKLIKLYNEAINAQKTKNSLFNGKKSSLANFITYYSKHESELNNLPDYFSNGVNTTYLIDSDNSTRYSEFFSELAKQSANFNDADKADILPTLQPVYETIIKENIYFNENNEDVVNFVKKYLPKMPKDVKLRKTSKLSKFGSFVKKWAVPTIIAGGVSAAIGAILFAALPLGAPALLAGGVMANASIYSFIGVCASLGLTGVYRGISLLTRWHYKRVYGRGGKKGNKNLTILSNENNVTADNIDSIVAKMPIGKLISLIEKKQKQILTASRLGKIFLNPFRRMMNRNRIHELAAFRADLDNQINRTLPIGQVTTEDEKRVINNKRVLLSYISNICNTDAENDLRNSLLEEESLSSFDIYNKHISERQRRRIEKTKNVNISEVKARADQMVGSILLTHLTESEPQKGIYPVKELLHMNDQEIEKRKNKAITEENKERTKQNLNVQDILIAPEINTYTTALEEGTGKKAANRAKATKAAKQANVNNQEPTAQQPTSNPRTEQQLKVKLEVPTSTKRDRGNNTKEQEKPQQPEVEKQVKSDTNNAEPEQTDKLTQNGSSNMLEKLFGKTTESSTPAQQPTSNPRTEQQPKVKPKVPTSTNRERGETTNNNPKKQEKIEKPKTVKENQQPPKIVATKSATPVYVDRNTGKAFVNGKFIGVYYNPKTKAFQKNNPSELKKRKEQGNPGLTDEEISDIQADEINF